MSNKKSRITIGLATDWSSNSYQIALINGIARAAEDYDINLVLYTGGNIDSPHYIEQSSTILYDFIGNTRLDGLIISGSVGSHCTKEKFDQFCRRYTSMPLLTITTQVEGIPFISTDNSQGFRELLLHLVYEHKYKNFAFIKGTKGNYDAAERLAVFQDVLRQEGIPYVSDLIFDGEFKYESGVSAVHKLLEEVKLPCDVIVAANDDMARGAMDTLQKYNIQIPRQIAVTGYDDQDISQFLTVPLTTVAQPIVEQGRRAMEFILGLVKGKKDCRGITLPSRFICRNSCGCTEHRETQSSHQQKTGNPAHTLYMPKKLLSDAILQYLQKELKLGSSGLLKIVINLVDCIIDAVQADRDEIFLDAVSGLLVHPLFKSNHGITLHSLFVLLRKVLLDFCSGGKESVIIKHLFCEAAFLMAGQFERDLHYSRVVEERDIHSLHVSIQEFVGILDMEHLAVVLTRQLPELGITSCFLSLYDEFDDNQFPWLSRLVFAYNEKGRIALPAGGEIFQTRLLCPEPYFPRHKRFIFELEGIFFSNKQLGFCIFEYDLPQIGSSWETARRTFIVVALKAALYVQKVQIDYANFEKKVNARTEELILVNQTLGELYQKHKEAEEQLRLLNDELERRVKDRTHQLASTNNQLQNTLDWLQTAQKKLVQSEKLAALGNLVAGVAHEINTPLGIGVTAASHLEKMARKLYEQYQNQNLKKSDLEEYLVQSVEASGMVLANLNRAHELISNFKKIAVDQSSEEMREFKVKEYIESLLISLKPRLKKTEHKIILEGDGNLSIHSYPGAFSQIITNFIINSLVHAFGENQKGTIILNFKIRRGNFLFRYFDNGRGIEKKNREKIFEPFFTTNRQKGATGLGLYLVLNIVINTLHGTIQCLSRLSGGTLFKIKIPLQDARHNT